MNVKSAERDLKKWFDQEAREAIDEEVKEIKEEIQLFKQTVRQNSFSDQICKIRSDLRSSTA